MAGFKPGDVGHLAEHDRISTELIVHDTVLNGRLSESALSATFGSRMGLNVKDFGAIGDGVVDDTAAVQACINAAGVTGLVLLPPGVFKITAPLLLLANTEIRGSGAKASELRTATDITIIKTVGGEGQSIRKMLLRNTAQTITRTTYDIDITNPTKTVIADVEIGLNGGSTMCGGIYIHHDSAFPGNSFMPQLSRVWIRTGHLVIDGVTDGMVDSCFVWSPPGAAQPGAISLIGGAASWTFVNCQAIPTQPGGAGYYMNASRLINLVGGYVDGSYNENMTGHGIRAVNSSLINVSGTNVFNVGRSAIRLESTHGCSVAALGVYNSNKQDGAYPDIDLVNSSYNTFQGTTHQQSNNRTNKGLVYQEDSTSTNNLFDAAVVDLSLGNYYQSGLFAGNAGTLGKRNRPASLWPRPSGVPAFITPPASSFTLAPAVAWPIANLAQFHRFTLPNGASFRTARLLVSVSSGNIQTAVVKMDGLAYTRVMTSGVVACPAVGDAALDMGATFLSAGEYALAVWADNTTMQTRVLTDTQLRGTQQVAEFTAAGGIPASGTLSAWNSTRAVTGFTLTA